MPPLLPYLCKFFSLFSSFSGTFPVQFLVCVGTYSILHTELGTQDTSADTVKVSYKVYDRCRWVIYRELREEVCRALFCLKNEGYFIREVIIKLSLEYWIQIRQLSKDISVKVCNFSFPSVIHPNINTYNTPTHVIFRSHTIIF